MHYYGMINTDLAKVVTAVWHEKGVCAVFAGQTSEEEALKEILRGFPNAQPSRGEVLRLLSDYFSGKKVDFSELKLDYGKATAFQQQVWEKTRTIPYGEIQTYGELAAQISPGSQRAVGQALGKNPIPVIVP